MKKWIISTSLLFIFFIQEPVDAKVIWNGSEIVEDQRGKMTFTKDVKVYKKLPNGQFESLVVKRNNYFRVYDIENQYSTKPYYWMSGGYRVQATNLVIFKEVPYEIIDKVMNEHSYVVTNKNGGEFRSRRSNMLGNVVETVPYGYQFTGPAINNGYITQSFSEYISCGEECDYTIYKKGFINANKVTQLKITEAPYKENTYLVLTKDTTLYKDPVTKTISKATFGTTFLDQQTLNVLPKGTVVKTTGKLANGYLQIEQGIISLNNVATLPKPTTKYLQYAQDISEWTGWNYLSIAGYNHHFVPRNTAVKVYSTNSIKAFVSYNGVYGYVPENSLSSKKATVPSISETISPTANLKITFNNNFPRDQTEQAETTLTNNGEGGWTNSDGYGFLYEESDTAFRFQHQHTNDDYGWFEIQKPIKEGSPISRGGKVLTVYDTYTTPVGTFKNVFVTDFGYVIAPGYGVIQFFDSYYTTKIE
ncbi:hypothetical protein KD050_10670 [Psychrobacillus sp. INOP01]|uniref:hypothetical protein n=1 Tax=Psychrobacillus sp. INOP01 TaxID=2829187 RepID=UPI001BADBBB8|nr:hypothetical protein [Psychrobacillus sp. INOP01]QUG43645.1 hypothetical protein KD050_10670 [Psychrobacillus sp. INOP01]